MAITYPMVDIFPFLSLSIDIAFPKTESFPFNFTKLKTKMVYAIAENNNTSAIKITGFLAK